MATKRAAAPAPAHQPAAPTKLKKFGPPDELPKKFHVTSDTDTRIDGIVTTDDIRELLNDFGLTERKEIVIPFQHIKRQHGETWAFRIDNLATHSVDGSAMQGHAWVYLMEQPEMVGSAQ